MEKLMSNSFLFILVMTAFTERNKTGSNYEVSLGVPLEQIMGGKLIEQVFNEYVCICPGSRSSHGYSCSLLLLLL